MKKRILFKAFLAALSLSVFMVQLSLTSFAQTPKPLFTINYGEKCSGTVNKASTATVTLKHEDDGEICARVVPNTVNPSEGIVALDCFGLSFTGEQLAHAKYASVKYKYTVPEGKDVAEKMTIRIMKNGDALDSSTMVVSKNKHVAGEWAYAYFDLSPIVGKVKTDGTFRQIHLYPFGQSVSPWSMTEGTEMLISEIAFWAENPDVNAQYTVSFLKGDPDAEGTTPKDIVIKANESYTLPENPYVIEDSVFVGWKSSVDGITHNAGTQLTCNEQDITYTAVFKSSVATPDTRIIPLSSYQGGIVDRCDTATASVVTVDGDSLVKIVPNAATTKPDIDIILDSFYSQTTDKINIGEYKYAVVRYYIDGTLPKEAKFGIRIMKNGNILTASTQFKSLENVVSGKWDYAVFDLSELKSKLVPELSEHFLKQIHIAPTFGIKAKEFTGNEAIYLENLILFKEKPELAVHEKYMNGYDGGIFKPNGNMTRAEACTIVARLSAGSDELVSTDKTTAFADVKTADWYYKYVSYVESLGYLKSYSGNLEPNKEITRAEFVELVYNMGLLTDKGLNGTFTDVTAEHPKASVISAAGKAGLVNGYDNGDGTFSFKPDNTITRAEVVKVINNALSRSIDTSVLSSDVKYSFNDVAKDFWAYADIMEATLTHLENKGKWTYAVTNPISVIGGESRVDTSKGDEFLKSVEALTQTRINEIRTTATTVSVSGTKYYVSNSGNDSNDGKTPETAWKTIEKVNSVALKDGDGVFFKRGDIFRERIKTRSGVTYSAYGEGDKPKIYGSPEDGADKSKWSLMEGTENIWVFYQKLPDVGMIVLDGNIGYKEIPDWYNGEYFVRDSKGTVRFDIKKELDKNLDFFSEIKSDNLNTPATLYLRCDEGNPGEVYNNIELATKGNIISVSGVNVTIDNLCVMYGGSHGIGSGTTMNLTVTNCEVGMIGGSLLRFYPDKFGQVVRYGNGIEIYGGCDGYTIDNCYVYQCYDAGVTHQYDNGGVNNISMYNITYSNNVIERCVYSIEYFNGNGDNENVIRDGKNYKIVGNILRLCGYGWGQQRPNLGYSTHIQGGSSRNEYEKGTYIIENNIFDRGLDGLVRSGASHKAWGPVYRNNTYIQKLGLPLGKTVGTAKLVFDYVADITIADSLGDSEAKVYWIS